MKVEVGDTYDSEAACLNCGELNDRATQLVKEQESAAGPKAGDVSICAYCGHVAIFKADGSLRELTADEAAQAARDPIVARLRASMKKAH